jgi:hypothetical protein
MPGKKKSVRMGDNMTMMRGGGMPINHFFKSSPNTFVAKLILALKFFTINSSTVFSDIKSTYVTFSF